MTDHYIPPATGREIAHPAPEGHRHEQMLKIAPPLIGNGHSHAEVFQILRGMYDASVSDKEIDDVITGAERLNLQPSKPGIKPHGTNGTKPKYTEKDLLDNIHSLIGDLKAGPEDIRKLSPVPIPDDPEEQAQLFLTTLYSPNEYVNIVTNADPNGKPADKGKTWNRAVWNNMITHCGVSTGNNGAWIRMNPTDSGINDDNIARFFLALVELDNVPLEHQYPLLLKLTEVLPVVSITESAKRGPHELVAVNAQNYEEYNRIATELIKELEPFGVDQQNKNPSRLTRLPGAMRGDKLQRLLYLNPEALKVVLDLGAWKSLRKTFQTFQTVPCGTDKKEPVVKPPEITPVDASDLLNEDLGETRWVIPGFSPEGLHLIVGKPKYGKSFLMLAAAMAIVNGTDFMEFFHGVKKGTVLYLALEDNKRRMQKRLRKLGETLPKGLDLILTHDKFPKLDKGGLEWLENYLKTHPDCVCIIIDTLQKLKGDGKFGKNAYENDVDALSGLQSLAGRYHISLMVVHHVKKLETDDPFDQISGSNGIFGTADTATVIVGPRDGVKTMHTTGRDIEDDSPKSVRFMKEHGKWEVLGNAAEIAMGENRQAIRDVIVEAGTALTVKQIREALKLSVSKMTPQNIDTTLSRMVDKGQLLNNNHLYSISNTENDVSPVSGVSPVSPVSLSQPDVAKTDRLTYLHPLHTPSEGVGSDKTQSRHPKTPTSPSAGYVPGWEKPSEEEVRKIFGELTIL